MQQRLLFLAALLGYASLAHAVDQEQKWAVTGSGSSALRDFVSDAVGNASQNADYGGLYYPFYTEGTGVGQTKFLDSSVDYTVGDYALSSANYNASGRPIVQFPIALGSVTVYQNITGLASPNSLRLNASVVAGIFQGNITTWDHPEILAINPNLTQLSPALTGKNITVIVRDESVAAALAFSRWLNDSSNGRWVLGVNSTIKWPKPLPNFIYTIGGSNLTGLIANHSYSIGFSDAYAGKKAKLTDAQLRNKNGDWLKYSSADFTFANTGNDTIAWPASPDKDWAKFNIVNLGGNKTWPVPTAAFAASNIDLRDKGDVGAAQKQLFGYLLGPKVAAQAPAYQEVALPPAFLNYSIWATNLIKTKSSLVFFPSNQLPSVGNPYNTRFSVGNSPATAG